MQSHSFMATVLWRVPSRLHTAHRRVWGEEHEAGEQGVSRVWSCMKTIGDESANVYCFSNFDSFIESSCIACGGNTAEFSRTQSCRSKSKATFGEIWEIDLFNKGGLFSHYRPRDIQSYTRCRFETLRARILKCMRQQTTQAEKVSCPTFPQGPQGPEFIKKIELHHAGGTTFVVLMSVRVIQFKWKIKLESLYNNRFFSH